MIVANTNIFTVVEALAITGGIGFIVAVAGVFVVMFIREDKDRPVIPWGARMKVEREKARLELDALEVKRLALGHQRTVVLTAIENGDSEAVIREGLPPGR